MDLSSVLSDPLKVTLQIPRILQQYCGGNDEFVFDAETVGQLLQRVKKELPELYVCICHETDQLRQHVNLFLNDELLAPRTAFKTQLKAGDIVYVYQSVSGG